jgi:enduracididine biosynthesis enzyme MppR
MKVTAPHALTARTTEPHGYSLPLSPSGQSAMLTPPPWHFTGEVIMVEYRADADAVAGFLPEGLAPGPDPGAAAAVFAEWQWCSAAGDELGDPARCQFSEFLILLACEYEGQPVARCPYCWVDQPVPLVRGWVQGMPKQFGDIHLTRAARVGRAGGRRTAGGRFSAVASTFGRPLARATVSLTGPVPDPPALHAVPMVHSRVFPPWVPSDRPAGQLVRSEVTGIEFSEVWRGGADLKFGADLDTDLQSLVPVEVGAGYEFSYAETLTGGRLLPAAGTRPAGEAAWS